MKKLFIIIFIIVTIIAVAIVGIIIGNGVYQNKKLFGAIESGDYAGAKQAVEKGAWINARKRLLHIPNLIPQNPTPLIIACEKGDENIISLLLDSGADINKKDSYTGQTPLLAALHGTKANRFSLAFYLIDKGANIYALQKNNTPLQETLYVSPNDEEDTIKEGFELFKFFMKNNADIKLRATKENALTYSARYKNYNVVKYLIENKYFDINSYDDFGNTALITAVKYGNENIVELLIELGADKYLPDFEGKTAVDYANESEREFIKSLLIE